MRFEFSTFEVNQLLSLTHFVLTNMKGLDGYVKPIIKESLRMIMRKLKAYSQEAFDSREKYREEMKKLYEMIENA